MIFIETGFDIATLTKLAQERKRSDQIYSVGLDRNKMWKTHEALAAINLAHCVTFQIQDPRLYLLRVTWADKVYLNSEFSLLETVDEFRAAVTTGATYIQIANYGSKGAIAVAEAEKTGWDVAHEEGFSILTHGHNDSGYSSGAQGASGASLLTTPDPAQRS